MNHLLPSNWPELSPNVIARLAPLQSLDYPAFAKARIRVDIKREDLLHPVLGGNKVYKLFGHLARWRQRGGRVPLASFGGAYSNHLLAVAGAGAALNCPTQGIVRGERPSSLSPTLVDAENFGMKLHFVSRLDYLRRDEAAFAKAFTDGEQFWIPEGGAGVPALIGCQALAKEIISRGPVDVICHACGTGASLAGIALGLSGGTRALGVSVLKGDVSPMRRDVAKLLHNRDISPEAWQILESQEGSKYGQLKPSLVEFMHDFQARTGVPLDAVYTAKLMWTVVKLAEKSYWPAGARIVVIHSGGLQGNRGYPQFCAA